jgi:hypothetical protein
MAIATNSTILNILINGDASGAIRALDQAGNAATTTGERWSALGGRLTAGVTVPLLGIGAASVQAASSLNEAASKVDVVFGDAQGTVEDFASTAAESFGISERAALEAAGTLGNLVVSMGGTQDAAADMSVDLVSLAGDLASFNNLDTAEVLEKIRSGLVGEIEPLRSLGVNFDAATVAARALTIAQAEGRDEASEADKVMARYQLILEQTTTAQGDFARTSDSLANQQRVATAELENSAAAIGQRLLPVAADAVSMVADLAGMFADLPAPVQDTVVKVGLLAAAIGPAIFIAGKAVTAFSNLGATFSKLGTGAGASTVIAAAGIGLVVTAIYQAEQRAERARQRMDDLADAMVDGFSGSALEANLSEWAVQLDAVGLTVDEVGTALAGGEESWAAFIAEFQSGFGTVEEQIAALGYLNIVVGDYTDQIEAAAQQEEVQTRAIDGAREAMAGLLGETVANVESTKEFGGAVEQTADSLDDLNRSTERYLANLAELHGLTVSVADAQIAVFDAIDAAAEGIAENGAILDVATEAGRRNTENVQALAGSYLDYAQALEDAKAPQEQINNALSYGRESVRGLLEQFGVAPQYIDPYLDALGLIPRDIPTTITIAHPSLVMVKDIGQKLVDGVAQGVDEQSHVAQEAMARVIAAMRATAMTAAGIKSPSTLFAHDVGEPISEGIAQGILDALDAPQSAIDELFDELVSRGNDAAGNIISGIGAVFASSEAQSQLQRAQRKLADLLNGPIPSGTTSGTSGNLGADPAQIAAARRDVAESQLGLIAAQERMVEAGQRLLGQGPEGEARFRRLGEMSGLNTADINALIGELQHATAWAGQFLPGDVSPLLGEPSTVTNNITVNLPPGSNGDDVVASLSKWTRTNGPLSRAVSV